jgi:cytochrome c peroxidase
MNKLLSISSVVRSLPFIVAIVSAGCWLKPEERLGATIFNDQNLSLNRNQSCASCHSLDTGGTGPDEQINQHGAVYEGSVAGRFGNRKPPAAAYATFAPSFNYFQDKGFLGGNFWDGRATGWKLGNPAADQAQGPFLNPAEQALPSAAELVARVCKSSYTKLFRDVWGADACTNVKKGFDSIALSIVAIEGSTTASSFSSKYDWYRQGNARLDDQEQRGLALFQDKGKCFKCHAMDGAQGSAVGPLFTDFTFDNLGIPRNPENPFYRMDQVLIDGQPLNPLGADWVDPGLGGFLQGLSQDSAWRTQPYVTPALQGMSDATLVSLSQTNDGKHRVPTLRNVDKRRTPTFVKAFGHNGYFKSLQSIVHFYNTRDVLPPCTCARTDVEALAASCWPAPEVSQNLNTSEVGNLQLADEEEAALVAFLGTLSDGWGQ